MVRAYETINEMKYIEVAQGKKETINGVPITNISKNIEAQYQKVLALISNYERLKKAILRSNAGITDTTPVQTVTVCGKQYTMAELIDVSDNVYGNNKHTDALKSSLLQRMKQAYSNAVRKVEAQHDKVEQNFQDYIAKVSSNEKQSLTAADIQKRSEVWHEDGDYRLIDPLNLKDKIDKLQAELEKFKQECDATMSEQNALRMVNVDLTSVD